MILAEQATEKLMIEATLAPTAEATTMVMEKATNVMGKATKMLKELDAMAIPKPQSLPGPYRVATRRTGG